MRVSDLSGKQELDVHITNIRIILLVSQVSQLLDAERAAEVEVIRAFGRMARRRHRER